MRSRIVLVQFLLAGFAVVYTIPVYAAPATIADIVPVIQNIIKMLTPLAVMAFLAMVVFGAFKFITSGGDPKGAAGARSTFTYAIIGVLLVIAAWLILLLIGQITGTNVTEVNVSIP